MSQTIKISIIEDDSGILEMVARFLSGDPGLEVVSTHTRSEDFFRILNNMKNPPQVILQDINLPGISGIQSLQRIKEDAPGIDVVMFTIHDESDKIFQALCAGASGYVLKSAGLENISDSIYLVARGGSYMSPSIARKVVEYFRPNIKSDEGLTPKEQQVVRGIQDGLSYKMIADKLQVSINTVNYHIKNIYKKLEVRTRTELLKKLGK